MILKLPYGLVNEYADNDPYERFAETPEQFISDPDLHRQTVNPKSKYYSSRMGQIYADGEMTPQRAQIWADRLLRQVYLSRSLKTIDEETYAFITQDVEQSRIDEVTKPLPLPRRLPPPAIARPPKFIKEKDE